MDRDEWLEYREHRAVTRQDRLLQHYDSEDLAQLQWNLRSAKNRLGTLEAMPEMSPEHTQAIRLYRITVASLELKIRLKQTSEDELVESAQPEGFDAMVDRLMSCNGLDRDEAEDRARHILLDDAA